MKKYNIIINLNTLIIILYFYCLIKKQYHKILRENHPDTTNKKGILFTPEELKNAYDIVKKFFFS